MGEEVREGNPSPGNKAGGITTLEEKSLGCIHKGGHSPINAVYDYAKQVESKQGLVIMDTPGNDPSSVAAMVAGGAQVVVFSSGRGTPTGNPIVPVIKITGNKLTFAKMEDNIDFDASPLIYGQRTLEELGDDLLQMVVDTANGKQTKAEALGFTEMANRPRVQLRVIESLQTQKAPVPTGQALFSRSCPRGCALRRRAGHAMIAGNEATRRGTA